MTEATGKARVDGTSSLEWVDSLPNAWHRSMVMRAAEVLPTFPGLRAVLVTGSLATWTADQFSDLDLSCVVDDDAVEWWSDNWREAAGRVAGPLVVANDIGGPVVGGFTLTPNWEHIDLIVHKVSAFERPAVSRVLYDPDGVAGQPARPEGEQDSPYYPGDEVELFLYVLGASAVTLGRGELLLAHSGVLALRQQLITVMLANNGVRKSDGRKRLNPYLTEEQQATLLSLPVAEPELASILNTYRAITVEMVTRARALARACGAQVPEALLAATDAHLARQFGSLWNGTGAVPAT